MSTGVLNASFPVRLFSLLFRPLFLDASGTPALVASAENAIFLLLVGTLVLHAGKVFRMARAVTYVRYALAFALMVALLLTITYYNVGLGLRQKTMFVPAILVMFVTYRALRRRAAALREAGAAVA
jgi:predicted benzoate:H+ symporter BenE